LLLPFQGWNVDSLTISAIHLSVGSCADKAYIGDTCFFSAFHELPNFKYFFAPWSNCLSIIITSGGEGMCVSQMHLHEGNKVFLLISYPRANAVAHLDRFRTNVPGQTILMTNSFLSYGYRWNKLEFPRFSRPSIDQNDCDDTFKALFVKARCLF